MNKELYAADNTDTSTFKRNLLIGFTVSFLLLIISSVASFVSIQSLIDKADWVEHTYAVITKTQELMGDLRDAETGQRGFLLTGKEEFLGPYMGAATAADTHIEQLRELTFDNDSQQGRIPQLQSLVKSRFILLQSLISKKRIGQQTTLDEMQEGRIVMDSIRSLLNGIVQSERTLLKERTSAMNRLSGITPVIIIVSAALSMMITLVSFRRITRDHDRRVALLQELEDKDRDINRRINIIQDVAGKIAHGEYSVRTTEGGSDGLGTLSSSLNRMASSLETSFTELADLEWQRSGIAGLNEQMLGEKETGVLAQDILNYVTRYTNSDMGAIYLSENGIDFRFESGYALAETPSEKYIHAGEGVAGQAVVSRKRILVSDIPADSIRTAFSGGQINPVQLAAIPILFEKKVLGVIELGALHYFTAAELLYIDSIGEAIGITLNTARNRTRLQELLHETQSQSEELQAQQSELENINTELEIKTEKLQASEEELRVQQEELLQANQELEERSTTLEERNQLITERNAEIQHKAEQLALSTKYKSEFLANMSHELRTPLNSILLLSKLMAENNDANLSSDQVEYAQVIQSSGVGLLQLINEILDLSKIESGKMELDYSQVNIAEEADDLQAMFNPLAMDKGIQFSTKIEPGVPQHIETDKLRLSQILRNLLSNAVKFTDKGQVLLTVSSNRREGWIDFRVEDTGIGIPREKQDMIFEAFQQADGSTRRKYGGTGLGLSITRELVKLLGGIITLESEPDRGSSFTVTIPLDPHQRPLPSPSNLKGDKLSSREHVPANEPAVAFPEDHASRPFISKTIPENIPDDRAGILPGDRVIVIIEDDVAFARALLDYTRKKGYKGVVAVRGDEGIDLVNQLRPAGVLLDIELPVKSGWEVMDDLKRNPDTRHIPVHVMSSHEVRNKSISQGAVNFLNKPVDLQQMNDVFKKIEYIIEQKPRKVMIVEENPKHARALAYYLETFSINTDIKNNLPEGIEALTREDANCVILDMGIPGKHSYDILEEVKRTPGLENLPIIIFTGRSLSKTEEMRIRQYADSIVVKTAHSYQRILDEVSLFLHVMEEQKKTSTASPMRRLGALKDVLNGKTVLIADDDVRNIFSLTKALENIGMTVLPAIDGKEALAQLAKHPVDIVLMDMMMPELDGYETTQRIRQHPKYRKLPVIAVTAKAMIGDREKCISAGASDYITKPVDLDQLLSLLRVWLYENTASKS
ncbi:response regulator [Flavihumibacter petaseus]|uniref:histidine kinase n=1 Tax=Flavihumibacter petaseus NBRC 106054 TaxID=1220578 RepID=A0A0E9MWT8_9BACT|nr:response regulator [Flavihumibacter petaseus]GAO41876.1 putative two-component hybrid sensor and regulator [Flavihumibacter petaseus NBRC 106054]